MAEIDDAIREAAKRVPYICRGFGVRDCPLAEPCRPEHGCGYFRTRKLIEDMDKE